MYFVSAFTMVIMVLLLRFGPRLTDATVEENQSGICGAFQTQPRGPTLLLNPTAVQTLNSFPTLGTAETPYGYGSAMGEREDDESTSLNSASR